MPVQLLQSEIYRLQKESLTLGTRLALEFAEAEIAADPSPGLNRRELADGGIVDTSVQDLLIEYRRVSPTAVELYRVYDLRSLAP